MLGQAHQQQEEDHQRQAHQQILHRVDRQAFQDFEDEEGGKGQRHEQQAIFGGPVRLRIHVHRLDEADAEAVDLAQRRAVGHLEFPFDAAQLRLRIGCQRRNIPFGLKAIGIDLAILRRGQEAPAKLRMGPVRLDADLAVFRHRHEMLAFNAVQAQVKAELHLLRLRQRHGAQRRVQPAAEGKQVAALFELDLAPTPVDFRDVADAAHVLDGQRDERFAQSDARIRRLARQLRAGRHREVAPERVLTAVHQHLVDAAVAAVGLDGAVLQQEVRIHEQAALRRAVQQLRAYGRFHFLVIAPGHLHALFVLLRVGNHQDGTDDGLFAHRIGGDAVDGFLAEFHPLLDRFLNHQQRQADHQHQAEHDQRFDE